MPSGSSDVEWHQNNLYSALRAQIDVGGVFHTVGNRHCPVRWSQVLYLAAGKLLEADHAFDELAWTVCERVALAGN